MVVQHGDREPGLGYRRIQGELANVGHVMARGTIGNVLKAHGLEPAGERSRKTTWKEFLLRHWGVLVAADFLTVEAWTRRGLTRI
jgi:putative transposase